VGEGAWLIAFIAVERIAELIVAQRNTTRLLAESGVEFGRGHYFPIVALHATWLAALWLLGREHDIDRALLAVFLALQALRLWTIASLGRRWTTRVIIVPNAPLVSRGPYRFMRHPNYAIVALEIAIVPLALGLPAMAIVFAIINGALLLWRIRVENAALASASAP
jgi:methyltransferase